MRKQTKGKCKYCGKEYTKGYMKKHLSTCKERQRQFASETGKKKCGYFELCITSKYAKDYWLFLEIQETATLQDLDGFLRDIWLECCGHLSAFDINGISYEVMPDTDPFWGKPSKSMDVNLSSVLKKDMLINYEYDFGSTTELVITVTDYRVGYQKKEKLTILSRNNPPELLCDQCGEKPAVVICAECAWNGEGLLCEDCAKTHNCGGDFLLNVCNSPRMGTCGYNGSDIYSDQFEPDI